MNTAPYTEEMFAFYKRTIETLNNGLDSVQTQASKALDQILSQIDWMPEEYKVPIKKWQAFSTQQLNRTTALMNDACSSYEPLFIRPKRKAAQKTQAPQKK